MFWRITACWLFAPVILGSAVEPAFTQTAACETSELTLLERHLQDSIVDVGYPEQDSLGDLMIWANKVYDEENSTPLGDVSGWCLRTDVGRMWECTFTMMLGDGRITAAGTALDDVDSVFSVTGGTGEFVGVTGEVTIRFRGRGGLYRYDYELRQCPR